MKKNVLCVFSQTLVCLLLPVATSYGQDAELLQIQKSNSVVRRQVNLAFREADTNQQLKQLAKLGEINIVADATRFGEQPQTLTIEEEDALGNWILKIANEQKLSCRRQGDSTFLFWSQPQVPALAQALVDDPAANSAATPDAKIVARDQLFAEFGTQGLGLDIPGPVDPAQFAARLRRVGDARTEQEFIEARRYAALRADFADEISETIADYLEKSQGWNRTSRDLTLDLPLSQFPTALADSIKTLVLNRRVMPVLKTNKIWFADDMWQQARVAIRRNPGEIPFVTLTVGIPQGKSWAEQRLALWPDRPQATRALPPLPRSLESVPPKRAPSNTPDTRYILRGVSDVLENLKQNAKLDAPVTLEVEDQPLPEFLKQLQRQSGVEVRLAPDSDLAQKRITSGVKAMPLKSMMTALSNLYRSEWRAQGDGYELHSDTLSAAQRAVFSKGDRFRHWQEPLLRSLAPARLTLEDLPDWQGDFEIVGLGETVVSPEGIAFSEIPAELQAKVKAAVQNQVGLELIDAYQRSELFHEGPIVQVRPGPSNASPTIVPRINTGLAEAQLQALRNGAAATAKPLVALNVNLIDGFGYPVFNFWIEDAAIQARKQQREEFEKQAAESWRQLQAAIARNKQAPQGGK